MFESNTHVIDIKNRCLKGVPVTNIFCTARDRAILCKHPTRSRPAVDGPRFVRERPNPARGWVLPDGESHSIWVGRRRSGGHLWGRGWAGGRIAKPSASRLPVENTESLSCLRQARGIKRSGKVILSIQRSRGCTKVLTGNALNLFERSGVGKLLPFNSASRTICISHWEWAFFGSGRFALHRLVV